VQVTPLDEDTGDVLPAGRAGCDWRIEATLRATEAASQLNVDAFIFDPNGYRLIDMSTAKKGALLELQPNEPVRVTWTLRDALLKPGNYTLGLWTGTVAETLDHVEPAAGFDVLTYSEDQRHEHYPGPYIARFGLQFARDDADAGAGEPVRVATGGATR
jgi:hypothetical protein